MGLISPGEGDGWSSIATADLGTRVLTPVVLTRIRKLICKMLSGIAGEFSDGAWLGYRH